RLFGLVVIISASKEPILIKNKNCLGPEYVQ
ncbi:MAG: hypothetical protein ACI9FD_003237, partial [Gammaproteobacteria bacterium]